jgi:hypothetical protein
MATAQCDKNRTNYRFTKTEQLWARAKRWLVTQIDRLSQKVSYTYAGGWVF